MKKQNKINRYSKNTRSVIKYVREKGPISRANLSVQMNISQPTMTRIIEKLVKAKILKETGLGTSSGGRRPILLEFNKNCSYAIGVELGRSDIKVALTDLEGNLLSFVMKETTQQYTIKDIVQLVEDSIKRILYKTEIDASYVLGVGVGMPGPLNETGDGRLSPPNFYEEDDVALKDILENKLSFPVTIDNDANVAALAEKWFGKGMEVENFAYIMADVGVGSGLIINNDIYRGINGEAGEIGHSTIDVFGEKCTCGNYGCLETFISLSAILNRFKKRLKLSTKAEHSMFHQDTDLITFEDILSASEKGSTIASQVLEETGLYLGVGIANLINLYAPETVIIGGKIGSSHPLIIKKTEEILQTRVTGIRGRNTKVFQSDLQNGVVLGAAALIIHRTFY